MARKWREQVLKRKNFAPTFIITACLWTFVVFLIIRTDPNTFGVLYLFFFVFFFAILLTFAILLANTRRGFFIALGGTLYLFLRFIGVGTLVNLLLIILVLFLLELYISYS